MPTSLSPLRYPGGKSKLFGLVSSLLKNNFPSNNGNLTYIEPFAGGSGLAIKLLMEGIVNRIVLNDFDYAIYCVWELIVNNSNLLCDFIKLVPLNISEWKKQRFIYENYQNYNSIQLGLATFYLNRTNVSGIIKGGVIGGLSQSGKYKMDARFNRIELINRVKKISQSRESIDLYYWDAKDFIFDVLPKYENTFIYFDPPYVKKGPSLYKNAFAMEDHISLFDAIVVCDKKWIVTYDYCDFIKDLYKNFDTDTLSIHYSTGQVKNGNEIIIYSPSILH